MKPGRLAALERRHERLERRRAREERRVRVLGRVRVATFLLAFGALAAVAVRPQDAPALRATAAAAGLAFLAAAALQRGPRRRERHLAGTLAAVERDRLRTQGRWRELPRTGEGLARGCAHAEDLGLVGGWSLFRALSRCATPFGERRLAGLLCEGAPAAELARRQEAALELARREGLRHRVEAEGSRGALDGSPPSELVRLLEPVDSVHDGRPWLAPLAALLGAATLGQLLYWLGAGEPLAFWWFVLAQLALFLGLRRRLEGEYLELLPHLDSLAAWCGALGLLGGRRLRSERLRELGGRVEGSAAALRSLERRLGPLSARLTALHPVLNVVVPWDLLFTAGLARWRASHARRVGAWFEALGDFEALSSFGGHAAEQRVACRPRLDERGPTWEAEAARHPLLPEDEAVPNDVLLEGPGSVLLVTGSNMSGKSTLLRTVGLNTVLAQAGGLACASSLVLRPCRLQTSIHVTDALDAGVSLFHAEVRRLKAILDAVDEADGDEAVRPVLFLVDEILRGTNTRERVIASRAVIQRLARSRSAGLVTSHEIALAALEDELPGLRNVHFQESVGPEGMSFDYLMREGPVTSTNALEVLRREGVELDFDEG